MGQTNAKVENFQESHELQLELIEYEKINNPKTQKILKQNKTNLFRNIHYIGQKNSYKLVTKYS